MKLIKVSGLLNLVWIRIPTYRSPSWLLFDVVSTQFITLFRGSNKQITCTGNEQMFPMQGLKPYQGVPPNIRPYWYIWFLLLITRWWYVCLMHWLNLTLLMHFKVEKWLCRIMVSDQYQYLSGISNQLIPKRLEKDDFSCVDNNPTFIENKFSDITWKREKYIRFSDLRLTDSQQKWTGRFVHFLLPGTGKTGREVTSVRMANYHSECSLFNFQNFNLCVVTFTIQLCVQ